MDAFTNCNETTRAYLASLPEETLNQIASVVNDQKLVVKTPPPRWETLPVIFVEHFSPEFLWRHVQINMYIVVAEFKDSDIQVLRDDGEEKRIANVKGAFSMPPCLSVASVDTHNMPYYYRVAMKDVVRNVQLSSAHWKLWNGFAYLGMNRDCDGMHTIVKEIPPVTTQHPFPCATHGIAGGFVPLWCTPYTEAGSLVPKSTITRRVRVSARIELFCTGFANGVQVTFAMYTPFWWQAGYDGPTADDVF